MTERMLLHTDLLTWFDSGKRALPWREEISPYRTWVSEIMLQQTQVATVIPYFLRWMERFPDVDSLAAASETEVLQYWQGLGYYRRARSLRDGAKYILQHGQPTSAREWRSVPGVGPYTAGAIASIALGESTPLVDGNVERVYARLHGDATLPPQLTRSAWTWAADIVHPVRPGHWNEALMELGATICRPRQPICEECPLQHHCRAFATGTMAELPTAAPKRAVVPLHHTIYLAECDGRFATRTIPDGEWWTGMTSFPLQREPEGPLPFADLEATELGVIRHTVTHHRIELTVQRVNVSEPVGPYKWLQPSEIDAAPLPAPHRRAWKMRTRR